MNDFFQGSSEAGEISYEGTQSKHWRKARLTADTGLTTPGTAITSPWIGTNKSPDTGFVSTVTQSALPVVNANKHLASESTYVLTQAMSPADKVDSWFASNSAGPSRSSTSRQVTRNTALTALADTRSQLSNSRAIHPFFDPTVTGPSTQDVFRAPFLGEQNQPPITQMDASTVPHEASIADRNELAISQLTSSDPFFDGVPKGPSQLSTSRWNARPPAFGPGRSTHDQAATSYTRELRTETPVNPGKYLSDM